MAYDPQPDSPYVKNNSEDDFLSKKAAKLLYGGVLETLYVTDLQSYLIYGPSNVGKTYLASMLQEYSPFDIVDC